MLILLIILNTIPSQQRNYLDCSRLSPFSGSGAKIQAPVARTGPLDPLPRPLSHIWTSCSAEHPDFYPFPITSSKRHRVTEMDALVPRPQCKCAKPNGKRQTTLTAKLGLLCLAPPSAAPTPRTPAPHAVRRIANTPVFNTPDASLTTFSRFPAEIRLIIYRLLLIYDGPVNYTICPNTSQLVLHDSWRRNPKYPCHRHGLFPAILECCRLTYYEGRMILYGENAFQISCRRGAARLNSWPLSPDSFALFRSLEIWASPVDPQHIQRFINLKKLQIYSAWKISEWEAFTESSLAALDGVADIDITISVPLSEAYVCWTELGESFVEAEAKAFLAYKKAVGPGHKICHGRSVRWEVTGRGYPIAAWDRKMRLRLTRSDGEDAISFM